MKPKTHLVFLRQAILIALLLAVLNGCRPAPVATPPITENVANPASFVPEIQGCAQKENSTTPEVSDSANSRSPGFGEEKPPLVEMNGTTLVYSRALNHNCCMGLSLSSEVNGNEIKFYETWTGKTCRCVCFSEVGGRLENLPVGTYAIRIIQKGSPEGLEPAGDILLYSGEAQMR